MQPIDDSRSKTFVPPQAFRFLRKALDHRNISRDLMVEFSKALKERFGREEIAVVVSVETVDVPGEHLGVILTLSSSDSLFDQRCKAERIAREECIKYFSEYDEGEVTKSSLETYPRHAKW